MYPVKTSLYQSIQNSFCKPIQKRYLGIYYNCQAWTKTKIRICDLDGPRAVEFNFFLKVAETINF